MKIKFNLKKPILKKPKDLVVVKNVQNGIKKTLNMNIGRPLLRPASLKNQKTWRNMPQTTKNVLKKFLPDSDKDGVPNGFDCQPLNPLKQDNDIIYKKVYEREISSQNMYKKGISIVDDLENRNYIYPGYHMEPLDKYIEINKYLHINIKAFQVRGENVFYVLGGVSPVPFVDYIYAVVYEIKGKLNSDSDYYIMIKDFINDIIYRTDNKLLQYYNEEIPINYDVILTNYLENYFIPRYGISLDIMKKIIKCYYKEKGFSSYELHEIGKVLEDIGNVDKDEYNKLKRYYPLLISCYEKAVYK